MPVVERAARTPIGGPRPAAGLCESDGLDRIAETVRDALVEIDVLVCRTGIARPRMLADTDDDRRRPPETNVVAVHGLPPALPTSVIAAAGRRLVLHMTRGEA
ncbi:hypothetical protein [Actinomadura algeriensis]|uniref:NAD(P)-dependent dehydrogenase (Short-subunit alcohol dehydrogenase family) n=1 Tax=Actinomadura algeriensis TaxID=1679523 RepID=A0ABR9K1C9_9ACTN|nr:hypothetical protein [Actinomadura algeriensis]MBE1536642.1 NAD(P)-dependent dehydrogenase (short-subunit alcohol dehydrogenase family) [Actinomadura algeriensis]